MNNFDVYCIKQTFKFEENNIYKCEIMSISQYDDPLDPLLYNVHSKENISMPYRQSIFSEYFLTIQELRKKKLNKTWK